MATPTRRFCTNCGSELPEGMDRCPSCTDVAHRTHQEAGPPHRWHDPSAPQEIAIGWGSAFKVGCATAIIFVLFGAVASFCYAIVNFAG